MSKNKFDFNSLRDALIQKGHSKSVVSRFFNSINSMYSIGGKVLSDAIQILAEDSDVLVKSAYEDIAKKKEEVEELKAHYNELLEDRRPATDLYSEASGYYRSAESIFRRVETLAEKVSQFETAEARDKARLLHAYQCAVFYEEEYYDDYDNCYTKTRRLTKKENEEYVKGCTAIMSGETPDTVKSKLIDKQNLDEIKETLNALAPRITEDGDTTTETYGDLYSINIIR